MYIHRNVCSKIWRLCCMYTSFYRYIHLDLANYRHIRMFSDFKSGKIPLVKAAQPTQIYDLIIIVLFFIFVSR